VKNQKNDLPEGTEHGSDILQKVIDNFALRTIKRSVISLHCHGLLSEDVEKRVFARFPRIKGV